MKEKPKSWWGDYTFNTGDGAQWEIGSLRIALQRQPRELIVGHETAEVTLGSEEWHFKDEGLDFSEDAFTNFSRFVFQSTPEELTILPALADRSLVSRPITPFTVPGNENAAIYISSPLWFTITAGLPPQTLFETPIQRPSDTWFGSSTRDGELCYASRTYGRLNLDNLDVYSHRAITEVNIHNNSTEPFLVERLNLPVPYLSLFSTVDNVLWTEAVTVVQTMGTSLAEFNIESEPPSPAASVSLVTPPRKDPEKGMLIRAFNVLMLRDFD